MSTLLLLLVYFFVTVGSLLPAKKLEKDANLSYYFIGAGLLAEGFQKVFMSKLFCWSFDC